MPQNGNLSIQGGQMQVYKIMQVAKNSHVSFRARHYQSRETVLRLGGQPVKSLLANLGSVKDNASHCKEWYHKS